MIGKYIKKQRTQRDFSQEQLAQELRISRPTYTQIEIGKREITVTEAKTLANVFNLSLEDFLNEKETQEKLIVKKETKRNEKVEIRITQKNLEKFKQVLLYVLSKVGAKENVGETVLHKLLYFIDFDYYEKYEENLMGATYIKNHHGPTSKEFNAIIQNMQENEEIETVKSKYFTFQQKKYLPLKRPNLEILSAREVEHIDSVLARLSDKNAKEIENYSHQDIPWIVAKDGNEISYESVFYRDDKYSVKNYDDEV